MAQNSNTIHGHIPTGCLHVLIFRVLPHAATLCTWLVNHVDVNLRRLLFGYLRGGKLGWIALQTSQETIF